MRIVNRPGNRPSHEGAADAWTGPPRPASGVASTKVLLRGDTDFSQTEHLDRWNRDGRLRFIFGYDARRNLIDLAERFAEKPLGSRLRRRQPPPPATQPRQPKPNDQGRAGADAGLRDEASA